MKNEEKMVCRLCGKGGLPHFECAAKINELDSHPTSNEKCEHDFNEWNICKKCDVDWIEVYKPLHPTSTEMENNNSFTAKDQENIYSPRPTSNEECDCKVPSGFPCKHNYIEPPTSNESWRVEWENSEVFKRITATEQFAILHGFEQWEKPTVTDFISQTLQKERERIIKEIEELRRTYIIPPRELVKSRNRRDIRITQVKYFNYNKALDDIINLIQNNGRKL